MVGLKQHRIDASGAMLHAVEAGSGPLLLLPSGWPQTLYSWHKVLPRLAERFRVVAFDLPGLGQSDPAKGGHDTGSIALAIDPVLDAFAATDCLLVTHDIGAWVGYAYAARRPERVRKLVLIDGAIPGLLGDDFFRFSPAAALKTWHFAFNSIPDLPEMLIAGRERAFLEWFLRAKSVDFAASFDEAALDAYTVAYAAPGRWAAGLAYYRSYFDSIEQNRATASRPLTMPVLAVGGEASLGETMIRAVERW